MTAKLQPLAYEFVPLPRPAARAVGARRLDYADAAILTALYDRDVPRNLHVRFRLEQLAGWIDWRFTDDALSKRLRRLREDGWLRYEQPRKQPYVYEVTLVPEPPSSEVDPSCDAPSEAKSGPVSRPGDPSTPGSRPSCERGETAAAMRPSANGNDPSDPSSPERPEKTSLRQGEVGVARAHENGTTDEAEQLDQIWAATRRRGYTWEPQA